MTYLLFSGGEYDFRISDKNEDGKVSFEMLNHENDATGVHATLELSETEIKQVQEWLYSCLK